MAWNTRRLTSSRMTTLTRSEEHTSELQSRLHLVCRLLLEKKKKKHQMRGERNIMAQCNEKISRNVELKVVSRVAVGARHERSKTQLGRVVGKRVVRLSSDR